MTRRDLFRTLLAAPVAAKAQARKPLGPNRKSYAFGVEMHKRIYDAPAGKGNPWYLMDRTLALATYGDVTGAELYYDSIIVTKRPVAKWEDIDEVVRLILRPEPKTPLQK